MIRIRRYLVAGLLVWVPASVTILVFRLLLGLMDRFLFWLPAGYRPDALLGYHLPGVAPVLSGILVLGLLLLTGLLAANFIGKRLVVWYESLLGKIPFVRTIYSSVKKVAEVLLGDQETTFRRVLLVEFPREGIFSLAFQTSDTLAEIQTRSGESMVTVFVPHTPNPTTGFLIFLPRSQVREVDMSVEDAIKMIVSLGVIVPKWHVLHPEREFARPKAAP